MDLLIIRHAIAVDPEDGRFKDAERPLTKEGAEKFKEVAAGLAGILPAPDVLLTSPLLRAVATAEIAGKALGIAPRVEPRLAGRSVTEILAAVKEQGGKNLLAIVGHEPTVSQLLARLLGTPHDLRLGFKKGGAALVDLGEAGTGPGHLLWFAPPKLLRRINR
jgi:phosphohistidine phosphatase